MKSSNATVTGPNLTTVTTASLFSGLHSDPHYNPIVPRRLYRKPTASEIRFGHGCTIWSEANVPFRKQFVTIDGTRWTVAR